MGQTTVLHDCKVPFPNMQLIARNNYILIRLHNKPGDGIVLPEGSLLNPYGEVLSVGPDATGVCKPGQSILFMPNSMIAFVHEGEELFFVPSGCVFGVMARSEPARLLS